jgi:hypothetical protein
MGSTFRLKKLKLAPFEPMKHAHLKYVTWKTAFLIAITSFRRCSDLQALCIVEVGEGSEDRLRFPAGPGQSPRRGFRSAKPLLPKLWGFEELQTFI